MKTKELGLCACIEAATLAKCAQGEQSSRRCGQGAHGRGAAVLEGSCERRRYIERQGESGGDEAASTSQTSRGQAGTATADLGRPFPFFMGG
jgi:hypothetical protein